jgi:hypothetical protein
MEVGDEDISLVSISLSSMPAVSSYLQRWVLVGGLDRPPLASIDDVAHLVTSKLALFSDSLLVRLRGHRRRARIEQIRDCTGLVGASLPPAITIRSSCSGVLSARHRFHETPCFHHRNRSPRRPHLRMQSPSDPATIASSDIRRIVGRAWRVHRPQRRRVRRLSWR